MTLPIGVHVDRHHPPTRDRFAANGRAAVRRAAVALMSIGLWTAVGTLGRGIGFW